MKAETTRERLSKLQQKDIRGQANVEPPLSALLASTRHTITRLKSNSGKTESVLLHQLDGIQNPIVEKVCYNGFPYFRLPPEAAFYRYASKAMPYSSVTPRFYGLKRSIRKTSIFISYVSGEKVRFIRDFLDALAVVNALQNGSGGIPPFGQEVGSHLPVYLSNKPVRRFRGNYSKYLQTLAREGRILSALPGTATGIEVGLARLESSLADHRLVVSHLDLLQKNLVRCSDKLMIIDWGEACLAPLGFDYGSLLSCCYRVMGPKEFRTACREVSARLAALAKVDQTLSHQATSAALFYFMTSTLKYLSLVETGERRLTPRQESRVQENASALSSLVEPIIADDRQATANFLSFVI